MLNLHRDKKIVRRELGRDGKILSDHRQDGNDEIKKAIIVDEIKKKKKKSNAGIRLGIGFSIIDESETSVIFRVRLIIDR